MHFARFVDDMTPFFAMETMERGMELQRQGHDIVQLAVGEPDFEAPAPVVEATVAALQSGQTHYTASRGLHALCSAIAEDCEARRGVAVSPEQVIVTSGTSPALHMTLRLLLDPGDEVIIPTPHYPCYPNMAAACDGRPVFVETAADDGYRIDVDAVRRAITGRTRCILIAAPANPTGAVQPREVIEGLCELGLPILSDEIYDQLLFDGARVHSPLSMCPERGFVFDGFSKRYAMTGFRLGYVIAPPAAARTLQTMQQNLHISASHFGQRAGIAALQHGAPHVKRMVKAYAGRRALLYDGLRALGLGVGRAPDGAFYILADARHLDADSKRLSRRLLEDAHVSIAPGRDFGAAAEGHLRFCYATSEERIELGLRRLRAILGEA
ncbi:MAG: pyridoxal phosphate-dependent aminotransferase [Myxococcales bacterium]|jgi:aspartate/methionine/tyrosine aminotransferase